MTDVEQVAPATHVDVTIPIHRWLMAVAILGLNVGDVYLTKAILSRGGIEANPVMRPIIDSPSAPIIIKTIVSLGVGALLLASPKASRIADWSVGFVLVVYSLVMAWNMGLLLQAVGAH